MCVYRVAELESVQAEVERLKRQQPPDEVPFSPAGPLFSEQDMSVTGHLSHLPHSPPSLVSELPCCYCLLVAQCNVPLMIVNLESSGAIILILTEH